MELCKHGEYVLPHGTTCPRCQRDDLQARLAECEQDSLAEGTLDMALPITETAPIDSLERRDDRAMRAYSHIKTLEAQLAETQRLLDVQLAVGDKLTAEVARLTKERDFLAQGQIASGKASAADLNARQKAEAELAALREIGQRIIANAGDFTKEFELHVEIEALRDALGR